MKKISYFLISILFFSNITLAKEYNLNANKIFQTTTLPNDSEIIQTIEIMDMTPNKKQHSTKDSSKTLEERNILPDIQKTDKNIIGVRPKLDDNPKKYTKHPPLIKNKR